MIKQIIVALGAILIGILIGGGAWYGYNMSVAPPSTDPTEGETEAPTPTGPLQLASEGTTPSFELSGTQSRIPVAVLPRYVPGAEETEILARQLADRQQGLERRDSLLAQREAAMKLILEDFQSEQELVSKLRKAVDSELQQVSRNTISEVNAAADAAETGTNTAAPAAGVAVGAAEQANIRKLGLAYDTMPAAAAASIFMEMDKEGLQDTVVRLLSVMKDRTAAGVLAEISNTDAELAARLTEKLRELPAAQPAGAAAP